MGGPFLSGAMLCEKILRETDGVASVIRIVDTFIVEGPTDEIPPGVLRTHLYVCFKTGSADGKKNMRIDITGPDGKRRKLGDTEIEFDQANGPQGGITTYMPIYLRLGVEGVYIIDLRLDGKRFTRLPFHVRYQQSKAT